MKSLKKYLLEARELVGTLPFTLDEFLAYLQEAGNILSKGPAYTKMEQIITDKYGEKVWGSFRGWTFRTLYTSDPEKVYATMSKMPVERLGRLLGAGAHGVGLLMKDKVIKWLHPEDEFTPDEESFYEYCLKARSKYFPRVYRFTDKYVVMEKVELKTNKCKEWIRCANISVGGTKLYSLAESVASGSLSLSKAEKQIKALGETEHEFFEWYIGAMKESHNNGFYPEDFTIGNIGERSNGEVVWFDI